MLQIFNAHGLVHYKAFGQKHVEISESSVADRTALSGIVGASSSRVARRDAEHGDLVLIEGWEQDGLDEIFSDDEAGKTYWWKRASVARWPLLGCECSFSLGVSLKLTETLD